MTQLTKTLDCVNALLTGADRLIVASQSNAAALTQAQADLANVDDTVSATLQPIVDKINAAAPVPVVDTSASADSSATADSGVTSDAGTSTDTGTADAATSAEAAPAA